MKRTVLKPVLEIEDEEWDAQDSIDVFYPEFDVLPGETPVAFNLRYAFMCAGYRVVRVEEVKTHPVVAVRVVRKHAAPINNQRLLFRLIRDLLRTAGFPLRRDELTVGQTGNRILVAFQSGKPAKNFEDILREPHEDFVDGALDAL